MNGWSLDNERLSQIDPCLSRIVTQWSQWRGFSQAGTNKSASKTTRELFGMGCVI